jgi:hypothetical protein
VGHIILRVRNVSTWIDIAFGEFIIEVEGTQSTAIFQAVIPKNLYFRWNQKLRINIEALCSS